MSPKSVLVHVDWTPRSDDRVALAAAIARRFDAHLTGLYVIEPEPAEAIVPSGLMYGNVSAALASSRSLTAETHAAADFAARLRAVALRGEWRTAQGDAAQIFSCRARHADLAIVGQSDPDDPIDRGSAVAVRTLLESGRPVVVVPYAGKFTAVGENVVVAWNDTREAARALNDALPFMKSAKKVTLLVVNPRWDGAIDNDFDCAAAVATHLERHNINPEIMRLAGKDISISDMILNRCFDIGADLLVAGGYGHSQLQERLVGGVTRTLLDQMTLPILLSH